MAALAADRPRFLRIPQVVAETGLSRATIYRLERAGNFPNRVQLSGNSMGWWSSDLDRWKADRLARGPG